MKRLLAILLLASSPASASEALYCALDYPNGVTAKWAFEETAENVLVEALYWRNGVWTGFQPGTEPVWLATPTADGVILTPQNDRGWRMVINGPTFKQGEFSKKLAVMFLGQQPVASGSCGYQQ